MINFVTSSQSRLCTQTAELLWGSVINLPGCTHPRPLLVTAFQEKAEAKEKAGQFLGQEYFLVLKR